MGPIGKRSKMANSCAKCASEALSGKQHSGFLVNIPGDTNAANFNREILCLRYGNG